MNRPVCSSSRSSFLISAQIVQSGDGNLIDLSQTRGIEKDFTAKQTCVDELIKGEEKDIKEEKGRRINVQMGENKWRWVAREKDMEKTRKTNKEAMISMK